MRRWCVGAVSAVTAAALVACGPAVDLEPHVAGELRDAVEELARAAAEERYDSAGAAAERLRDLLERAAEQDAVSLARYRAIDDALTRTEAELDRVQDGASVLPEAPE